MFSANALLEGSDLINNAGYQAIMEFIQRYVNQVDEATMSSSDPTFVMSLIAEKRSAVKILSILKAGPQALDTELRSRMTPENIEKAKEMGILGGPTLDEHEIIN